MRSLSLPSEPNTATAGRAPAIKPGDVVGYHAAMDVVTGKFKWKIPVTDMANSSSMLVTDGGQLIRCPVNGIRIAGRSTQGVIVFDTAEGEKVVSVERIGEEGGDGEG